MSSVNVTISNVGDDDGDESVVIESHDISEPETIEALLHVCEAVIQQSIRANLEDLEHYQGTSDEQKDYASCLHARLALIGILNEMDLRNAIGAFMEL